ncbi:hypothetical protein Sango_3107300 [Sesamum angolense]|uniref:Retrotransposon gag domain-containing protein n=1 Tax=Sesamum angolense TaxID=2727404 RepID=A0AAE1T9B8_9LAMI|nr:hypothetical protein Sango_3107300 [Sesamum angolense]
MAIVPERTINDMTSPDLNQQSLCIEYPDLEVNFELKSGLIHLLPTFRGLAGEDPHKHLKEFHVVCSGMRPQGGHRRTNQIKSLPFLSCRSSETLAIFPTFGIHHNWNDLKRRFLEKYFPASRATTIRKEISGIRQFAGESSFEYWGRFNEKLIDAASGGALFNKTPTEARNLISIMASNTQQFGTRYDDPPRRSNEVSVAAFDDRLNELTSLVKKLAVERTQHVKACGICTSPTHVTDMCPTLQETPTGHADAIGGFSGQQQRRYDPFSNTYNPGWKDHPNLSYGAQSQNFQRPQYRPPMPSPSNPKQGMHLEDMMKSLISNTQQFQQNTQQQIQQLQQSTEHQFQQFQQSVQQFQLSTQTSIQNLESQLSQLASSVSKLESQGKLPSQTVINPKQNASAIVLRSGKELQENRDENGTKRGHTQQRKSEKEVEIPQEQDDETKEDNPKVLVTRPHFRKGSPNPRRMKKQKRSLKLFASKCKLKGNERVSMGENVSAILQRKLPPKCKDPARRPINCLPEGVLEDVLVQVNELVFPADFYVLDMREDNSPSSTAILLGRQFLKTARTKIDVHAAIDDKDYINLALEEIPMPMEGENMGVDPLVQVNAKFDGDSVFLAKINKDLTYGPRTYKNKAFHDKISSRKNSLMNIKVFMGPHHLRKYT